MREIEFCVQSIRRRVQLAMKKFYYLRLKLVCTMTDDLANSHSPKVGAKDGRLRAIVPSRRRILILPTKLNPIKITVARLKRIQNSIC